MAGTATAVRVAAVDLGRAAGLPAAQDVDPMRASVARGVKDRGAVFVADNLFPAGAAPPPAIAAGVAAQRLGARPPATVDRLARARTRRAAHRSSGCDSRQASPTNAS